MTDEEQNDIAQPGEGFAFFAWHRLRWPSRTQHPKEPVSLGLPPDCQRNALGEFVCYWCWRNSR